MRTRVHAQATIVVDLIRTKPDVAGVSIFSQTFDYDLDMKRDSESRSVAVLHRAEPVTLSYEIMALVYLQAQADGVSIDHVLDTVKRNLLEAGFDSMSEPVPAAIRTDEGETPDA